MKVIILTKCHKGIFANFSFQVIKVCRPLILEDDVLKLLMKKFSVLVTKALSAELAHSSTVKCNLTYVSDFPDGTERGSCIGLEFSGRIFRVAYAGLKGDHSPTSVSKLYEFPEQRLTGDISKVVDYVAKCVNNFIEFYDLFDKKLILGVSSSFPMVQECLQEGQILKWGKDFQCIDLQNKDFFMLLKMSLKKFPYTKGIYLISLVNNSTAALVSALYKDPAIRLGVYLGDDTNITYIEKFKNMTKFGEETLRAQTAINVEMKNFGDDGALDLIKTEFDYQIDAGSDNPGKFILEKMVSGAYLGEIARLVLHKLISKGVILNGYITPMMSMRDGLKTSDIAMMEMDEENKFLRCRAVLRNLGYKEVSSADCLQIRFVCRCVARRSSNIIAACLASMVHRIECRDVRIMGDGFLLKDFPNYKFYLTKKMNQLKKKHTRYTLILSEKEETAVGAGLVAFTYKDEIIKLEDKHRALPPFDATKYNLPTLPAAFIECECEPPPKPRNVRSTKLTETIIERPDVKCKDGFVVFDFAEPVFTRPVNNRDLF